MAREISDKAVLWAQRVYAEASRSPNPEWDFLLDSISHAELCQDAQDFLDGNCSYSEFVGSMRTISSSGVYPRRDVQGKVPSAETVQLLSDEEPDDNVVVVLVLKAPEFWLGVKFNLETRIYHCEVNNTVYPVATLQTESPTTALEWAHFQMKLVGDLPMMFAA